ncbi:MAG: hypothetical protein IJB47_04845 [Oscillospiraceae bacterium]|nr:hypothetical protein [Oscillospiraceae bacterium]
MKKYICLLMSLVILMMTVGCAALDGGTPTLPTDETSTQPTEDTPVLPPARWGNGMYVSFSGQVSFEDALENADAIARIRIGDWLCEDTEGFESFFEAEVLECIKGELPQTFVLAQFGNSIHSACLLFTYGNELFVFLERLKIEPFEALFENTDFQMYATRGEYQSVFDVSYDKNGKRYYCDTYGAVGKGMDEYLPSLYETDRELFKEVYDYAMEDDPVRKTAGRRYKYVFAEDDVIALIQQYE